MSVGALVNLSAIIEGLPLDDIEAAINDPTNLGKEAQVVEDIISLAMPNLTGTIITILISLFVNWVYASGGGIISPEPDPEVNAQTTTTGNKPR
jgi:hypothetical protein